MADIGVSGGLNTGAGGGAADSSAVRSGGADQLSFEQARDVEGRPDRQNMPAAKSDAAPPDTLSYRQHMGGLRKERGELQAERDILQAGIANKTSVPEMQQEVQRVAPQLAKIDQEIARNEREQIALARGMEPNATHEEGETCKIEVRTKPAVAAGIPGNHSYITLSDADGEHYVRGGPERAVQKPEDGGLWGKEVAQTGRYVPDTMDWSTEDRASVTVAEVDGDCSPHFEEMKDTAQTINDGDHSYRAIFDPQNCNSVTHTVLKHSGHETPELSGWSPGIDKDLLDGGNATQGPSPDDTQYRGYQRRF